MGYIYAGLDEIKNHHDKRVLVQLTNDDDTIDISDEANINVAVLQVVENEAAQTIDNFLRYVYDDLPLTGADLTQEIKTIAAHLTWCTLWERRGDEPQQITDLRTRMLERLEAMGKAAADEVRGARSTASMGVRSATGKARTLFDKAGYFDGLGIQGRRRLPGDVENEATD